MKVQKYFSFVLALSLLLTACNPAGEDSKKTNGAVKKPEVKKPTENAAKIEGNGDGSEHCLNAGEKQLCFLEKDTEDGSTFYAYGDAYQYLLVDPILADIQIQLNSVDQKKYEELKKTTGAKLAYDGAKSNGVLINANVMDEQAPFTDLMFRIIAFLWKADKNYGKVEATGTFDKIKEKLSGLKDKVKGKVKSLFGGSSDGSANAGSALGLKAKINWKYGTANVLKELPIPPEYLLTEAELKELEKQAAAAQMMQK